MSECDICKQPARLVCALATSTGCDEMRDLYSYANISDYQEASEENDKRFDPLIRFDSVCSVCVDALRSTIKGLRK